MMKRRIQLAAALMLLGTFAATPVFGQGGSLEQQATALFNAKDYKGCVKLLEKEVQKPDASVNSIRLAMNANLRMGNPMSAALLASDLLKRTSTKDPDALFEAAQAAELAGDDRMALSRYLSYLTRMRNNPAARTRVFKALSYVMMNGQYEDAIEAYTTLEGRGIAWERTLAYADAYLNRSDMQSVIKLVAFMLKPGDTVEQKANSYHNMPAVLGEVIRNIYRRSSNINKTAARELLTVLTTSSYPANFEASELEALIVNCYKAADMSDKERFQAGRRYIETTGLAPSNSGVFLDPANAYLKSVKDKDPVAKERAVKEVLDVMPYLQKTNNLVAINAYQWLLRQHNDVLAAKVDPAQLAALLAQGNKLRLALSDESDAGMGGWSAFSDATAIYKDAKDRQVAFANAALSTLTPEQANWLFENDAEAAAKKGGSVDQYLAIKDSPVSAAVRESRTISGFASAGHIAAFVKGAKTHMLTHNYNDGQIADLIRKGRIPANDFLPALAEVIQLQGACPKNQRLIDNLNTGAFKGNSKLAGMKGAKKGSDPIYAAVAAAWEMGADKLGELEKISASVLNAYKGKVPADLYDAKTPQQLAIYNLMQHHKQVAWGKNENAAKMIQLWLPRLENGKVMNELLSRAWNIDGKKTQGGLYYNMVKYAIANNSQFWGINQLRTENKIQPKADSTLFEKVTQEMAYTALAYSMKSADSWSKAYFFKQIENLMKAQGVKYSRQAYWELYYFLNSGKKKFEPIPVSTITAILEKMIDGGVSEDAVDFNREASIIGLASKDDLKNVLLKYADLIKKRSKRDQLRSINAVASLGNNIPDDVFLAFAEASIKPLLASWPQKEWLQAPVSSHVMNAFARITASKLDGNQKTAAASLFDKLSVAVLRGNAAMSDNIFDFADKLQYSLEPIVKDGNIAAVNRAAAVIGFSLGRHSHNYIGKNVADNVLKILDKMPPQISYVFLSSMTNGTGSYHAEMKKQFSLKMSELAKDIPGLVPVDKSDPAYNLFLAQQMKREGNALQAWSLVRDRMPLLTQRWKEFDFDFALWGVEQARKSTMYKEAMELGQTMWMDEASLSAANAAKLGLSKGDVYRDWKSYPAAKIEYESLTTNKRYAKTAAGRLAKFRLIELLILTQDYTTARTMLERLQASKTQDDQAEAYYLQARVDYELMDDEAAMANLGEVFMRNSTHPEARLLQGQIMLRTNKLHFTELRIGQQKLATVAIPGKPIKLLIQDTNLSIIRGGKSLPVLVTTTKGKDREIVELMPNSQDPNMFSAELATCLGKVVPNNMLLELTGEDEIIYQVEPKFQAENGAINLPPKHLNIRFPAKLYASSQTILSDEEQEELKLLQSYELTSGIAGSRNSGSIVRPGSPINVRVVDYDMSIHSNKPDTVTVDVISSSGDEIKDFVLTETGDCTGVFEGKIETGIPFPNTVVSDMLEGLDVNAVINNKKTGSWKSQPDGKRPKWLEVDTMTSCNFKEASITMPNPAAIKSMRVVGSIDQNADTLAVYPALDSGKIRGGLRVHYRNGRDTYLDRLQRMFLNSSDEGIMVPRPSFSRDTQQKLRGRDSWICGMISGAFYLNESQQIEFKFMQKPDDNQTVYFFIDDRLQISGRMNATGIATKRSMVLNKGIHTVKIYFNNYDKDSAVTLGVMQPDGSCQPMPADWFNAEKNPLLAEYLKPKGKITQTADGFKLTMEKPLRYRRIRWVFEDFIGNQIEVTKAAAIDDKGKAIVPTDQDLSSGKNNRILEVAAADSINIKYEDKKRIDDNKAVLTETMSSAFRDAIIKFCYEDVEIDDEGKTRTVLSSAARATKGDSVIVFVSDPDEDRTDDREVVKVDVFTSSGEKIVMELLEAEGAKQNMMSRGTFQETFRVGDKTDQARRTLKVVPGDKIYARYMDRENNKPGIPYYRQTVLDNNEGSRPYLTVYDAVVNMIEDRSPAALAKIQMMRNRQGNRLGDIKLFKEQITAKAIVPDETQGKADKIEIVNSKAPLLLELSCPELAKHAGSTAFVDVLTTTEINAADSERRERMPLRVEMPLKPLAHQAHSKGYPVRIEGGNNRMTSTSVLEMGLFSGVVRLQLGSANDEINDLVTSNETFNLLSEDNSRLDGDAFKVPTVIVSGSDKIFISFKDASGKELAKKTVQLRSDGELELFDKAYLSPMRSVHLGQHFYIRVHDPDRDVSPERDTVEVSISSKLTGDKVTMKLSETLQHSGIFTGSLKVDLKRKPLAGQSEPVKLDANTIWSNFGDKISFSYVDEIPLHSAQPRTVALEGEVVIGSDGELAAFTKKFKDPDMAVKTNFLMAEALFEMAKSHKAIKGADGKPDPEKVEQAKREIAKGKRVLEEALRDYPNTSLKAQGEFLLANLSQQLEDYRGAISQFSTVISRYPDSEYAPKSYYQKAVCYERLAALEKEAQRKQQMGDLACEEFVRLTYLYPTSNLATDAKLRLGNYYYHTKRYRLAASVLEKFGMAHPEHNMAAKALLLAGYASRRNEELKVKQMAEIKRTYKPDYTMAVRIFSTIEERYKDNKNERAEALYFAGDSLYLMETHENKVKAYQYFQRLIWDYPESKWAKYARGRMASNPIKNIR